MRARWFGAALLCGALVVELAAPAGASAPESWVRRYNGTGNTDDGANAIAVSPDGTKVFVTGFSDGPNQHEDYVTNAYRAADGVPLWGRRYNGTANGIDIAKAITVSHDGTKVFVTGFSAGAGGFANYVTFAYRASDGAPLWGRRFTSGTHRNDIATAITASSDGTKVFVTGYGDGSLSGTDYVTYAYRASNGASLWARRYNGTGNGNDIPTAIAVGHDGTKVYVTGSSTGTGGNTDYVTYAYRTADGASVWGRRYNGTGNGDDRASAIAVAPNGGTVVVTGRSTGRGRNDDYVTNAYRASDGATLWGRRYNGSGNGADAANAVAASPDGTKFVVTGRSAGPGGDDDFVTYAYRAADGASVWGHREDGTGHDADIANAVGISRDGTRVFVSGLSVGAGTEIDYLTHAYRAADGAALWGHRYDGTGHSTDVPTALAVSPDGRNVFVTGESTGPASIHFDYLTVAYKAV